MRFFNPYTIQTNGPKQTFTEKISILKEQLNTADAVMIGAGSGLSTAAGYVYTGKRMETYFSDFMKKYGFSDMYSGGFYPYPSMEEFWGFWCRYIWINRYATIPSDLYERLFELVKDKDYFVLTTNVDHCFQRSGFDKKRLFYTQGDYGLLQSSKPAGPSAHRTYDNYDLMRKMVLSEGYEITDQNELRIPEGAEIRMSVPTELVPVCPDDGQLMTTNLRCDDSFVEDEGWHEALERYQEFLRRHEGMHVLYLEIGVGMNTPVIIHFGFQRLVYENPHAIYANVNLEPSTSREIADRSILIRGDIADVIRRMSQ